jgi:aspartate kinase
MKTAKFGGSSLANSAQIKKVIDIIKADPDRRCVVVSAPGKANQTDRKITDLLYALANPPCKTTRRETTDTIISRYQGIARELGVKIIFNNWFNSAMGTLSSLHPRYRKDFLASRGEYWMAQIMALALGYKFIDATRLIAFNDAGLVDIEKTQAKARIIGLHNIALHDGIVVPGFYGTLRDGEIKTFSRGGSDITGAIVALCTNSTVYENWTDVDGVLVADPRIVDNPHKTDVMTYRELRELAYMGANVLHEDAIFPVRQTGIPINIRNTNSPNNAGTLIATEIDQTLRKPGSIVGIAGKKGFSVVKIDKALMNNEVGFLRIVCQAFENYNINIEHIPGGIDTLSVIVAENEFELVKGDVLSEINILCKPESLTVENRMAMICIVIADMMKSPGITARICFALSVAGIDIRMVNQGASAISIIIGVNEKDYEESIRAIYNDFVS